MFRQLIIIKIKIECKKLERERGEGREEGRPEERE
jgi:hypothetical protein